MKKSPTTFSESTNFSNSNPNLSCSSNNSLEENETSNLKENSIYPDFEKSRFWPRINQSTSNRPKADSQSSKFFSKSKETGEKGKSPSFQNPSKSRQNDSDDYFDPIVSGQYRFLVLKNLHEDVTPSHIYNLFQCYGKVSIIYLMEAEHYALVEFQNARQASVCKNALNGLFFFNKKLDILILSPEHFQILKEESGYFCFSGKQEIFNSKTKFSFVNYPSDTIYVSNIRDSISTYEFLVEIFGVFGSIQALKLDKKEKDKNTCFIRYSDVSESIIAIANMNMRDICGRKLNVSFTKTNLQ